MVSSTILTLVVIPAVYSLWKEWQIGRAQRCATGTDVKALEASAGVL